MKFGIVSPYLSARKMAEIAQMAEAAGWDGLFAGDAIWCEDPIVGLAAAAMTTRTLLLGTMVTPVPLRRPWKIASESVALDRLSNGRTILGLGMGAVWMGWQGFPDEATDVHVRAEMLDETIDILTLLYQRKPIDYDGKQYHLKLTLLDEMHYPPAPVQQPRIPLWVVGVWPRKKSMARILKCDGVLPQTMNAAGEFVEITPEDIRHMKTYIDANRTLTTPFDIVVEGKTGGLHPAEQRQKIAPWIEAGVTWWIESLWGETEDQLVQRVQQGPPAVE